LSFLCKKSRPTGDQVFMLVFPFDAFRKSGEGNLVHTSHICKRQQFHTKTSRSFQIRVTRLDDFSFIGRLIALGSFLKITEVAKISGLVHIFNGKSYELILTK
jgi:hypothetical protein